MTLIEELTQRGMVQDIMPGTEELFEKERVTAYIGVDPTADSLHVGNLASLMLLVHLQKHGHQPVALIGGATGMIGDPSGKSKERNLLDEATLQHNVEGVLVQFRRLLDFESTENPALLENNYDWFRDMHVLDFLRRVGKHLTLNYMLAKDSVKSRIETGISFTEFSYQLIQGYDFYHLYTHRGVKVQMGGSDQWGNITAGTELIRRMGAGEAYAFTCPLITKSDGSKFGKSESGNVWLDAEKTSPYRFYQFWMNAADDEAEGYLKRFTLMDLAAIDAVIEQHRAAPHERLLQSRLAQEVTTMVHGSEAWEQAVTASRILFRGSREDLMALDRRQLLEVLDGVPTHRIDRSTLANPLDLASFLATATGIMPSKSEAARALKQNSIRINNERVVPDATIGTADLLNGEFVLVQKGKKYKYLVVVE